MMDDQAVVVQAPWMEVVYPDSGEVFLMERGYRRNAMGGD